MARYRKTRIGLSKQFFTSFKKTLFDFRFKYFSFPVWLYHPLLPVRSESVDIFLICFYACFKLSVGLFSSILNRQHYFRPWLPILRAPWVIVTSSIWPTGNKVWGQRYHKNLESQWSFHPRLQNKAKGLLAFASLGRL